MNRLQIVITSLCLCVLPLAYNGCKTTGGGVTTANLAPDQATVVKAEQTLRISKDTFDLLLRLEYEHRKFVLNNAPAIHTYAEYLRKNGPTWLLTANTLKNDYKSGHGNLQSLLTALANLTANINQSKTYINQIQKGA